MVSPNYFLSPADLYSFSNLREWWLIQLLKVNPFICILDPIPWSPSFISQWSLSLVTALLCLVCSWTSLKQKPYLTLCFLLNSFPLLLKFLQRKSILAVPIFVPCQSFLPTPILLLSHHSLETPLHLKFANYFPSDRPNGQRSFSLSLPPFSDLHFALGA